MDLAILIEKLYVYTRRVTGLVGVTFSSSTRRTLRMRTAASEAGLLELTVLTAKFTDQL